ncbi:MAG: ABC transporter ATP-binding protein [Actinomycetota bacterium]|nr:ABC transporter ATP-binding protein [Actinomycetota bacterium]
MKEIVKVKCLKHVYPDSVEISLCGLDFVVCEGERVAILGPNGSGKTTLLSHIIGLLKASEGKIEVFDKDPKDHFDEVISKIGVVFQNVDDQIIGPTVQDDISFTLRNRGIAEAEVLSKVAAIMDEVGITELKDRMPHNLSGGEKKKVALAGALVTDPKLLILDESLSGLDQRSQNDMIDILLKLNENRKMTIVMTTHDVNLVWRFANVVYLINHAEIVGKGVPADLFLDPKSLEQVEMVPPDIPVLFASLRGMGYDIEPPKTLDEAVSSLANFFDKKG